MDFYTDDELEMMDQAAAAGEQMATPGTALAPVPPPIPLYPIPGQAMGAAASQQPMGPNGAPMPPQQGIVGMMRKPMGPLPMWAWLLIGGGVLGTGYFALRKNGEPEKNGGGEDSSSSSKPSIGETIARAWSPSPTANRGGWAPSRSAFADRLKAYFQKKGMSEHVVVWHDADDAKQQGGMQFVSPLINVQVKGGGVKADAALTRFCRREGLDPKAHSDGNIGLYPHSTKRGKEWEEYIDALRDDGQSV